MEQRNDNSYLVARQNAYHLEQELNWFATVLDVRAKINFGNPDEYKSIAEITPPDLSGGQSPYAEFVNKYGLGVYERLLVVLSLVPHIKPEMLDMFLASNANTGQIFTEFGGRKGKISNGFLPTAETFLFIAAGANLHERIEQMRLFDASHYFWTDNILETDSIDPSEPRTAMPVSISLPYLELFTTGHQSKPRFGQDFPASPLTTQMEWEDLVLPADTRTELQHILTWANHKNTLLDDWGMAKKLKPGYKALFYGQPGTGKSLAAALLGKALGSDVYRIDLSKIVSKYIGETGKNLSRIFDRAENRNWILFFDEADSLFGKRTQIGDSHDRYANQEISFLLQRIEDYNGLVILASNLRHNIDDAFVRRFQSIIEFPMPGIDERLRLWQNGFSPVARPEEKLDFTEIARKYEIPGGLIMNVVQYSSLRAISRGNTEIKRADVMEGIRIELKKNGRTL